MIHCSDVLKRTGYRTALVGKWHLGHGSIEFGPNSHGFDEFYGFLPGCIDFYKHTYRSDPGWYRNKKLIEQEGYATDLLTDEAIRFLEDNENGPFFLYLAYNAPHYGKCPEGNLLQTPPGYPNLPEKSKSNRDVYKAMVENLDRGIGRVLSTLQRLNLEKNTIVIFLSDNGGDYDYGGSNRPYRGEKGTLWEGGIKLPCMMQWKDRIRPHQERRQLCSSLDLFPTLAHFVGVSPPARKLDGLDLYDVIMDNSQLPQRYLFFRQAKQIAVRDNTWKYLQNSDGTEYLFNLTDDPYEKKNIIANNREQMVEMRAEYEKFSSGL